jgi:8-oxo-dGTP pyrophosphatase MutT (NUDIX family)
MATATVAPAPVPVPFNTKVTSLPKPRAEMTEADWIEFDKTSYKTWYKNAGLIIFKDNMVLLVQDAKTLKWSFPKGAPEPIDANDPKKTAIRETYEEVGLLPETDYTFDNFKIQDFPHNGYYYFATATPTANPRVNDEEGLQVRWCTRAEVSAIWAQTNLHIKHFVKNYW